MNTFLPTNPKIHIYGRTLHKSPLPLFWTASGIEFVTDASSCYLDVECDYDAMEQWIRIEVEEYTMIRMPLERGRHRICVFHDLVPGCRRKVNFWKEVQPMGGDEKACLLIHGVDLDGELLDLPEKKYRLEFVGDSITSGEGLAGSPTMGDDWAPIIFTTKDHYALTCARALNADFHIVSQCGWGVCTGWDNNPACAIPPHYGEVCSVLKGEKNKALGAMEENDFSWQPDAVMVNLGTNDCGAFTTPPFVDPVTGKEYKLKKLVDDSYEPESLMHFENCLYDFLVKLRDKNPKARILWLYGMIGNDLSGPILETIGRYKAEHKDEEVYYLELQNLIPEWEGAHHHPGPIHHKKAADVVIGRLQKLLD